MLTVIVSTVIGMLLVGAAIFTIYEVSKKAACDKLRKMLIDYRFESSDGHVRFKIENYALLSFYVGETAYDCFEEALARESFTKQEHGVICAVQEAMKKEIKIFDNNMVQPKTFREFKNTPAGTIRIYNDGPIKLSPRFTIILRTNHEGKMEIGRAFLAEKHLMADNFRYDFKLVAIAGKVTEDEALEERAGFDVRFLGKPQKYSEEIAEYNEILAAIKHYNKHRKDFAIERGKMVWNGKIAVPTEHALPEPTVRTVDPEREEVNRLILSARSHK